MVQPVFIECFSSAKNNAIHRTCVDLHSKSTQVVFIFRRDLRLNDNMGLIEAIKNSNTVIPIFIFTPEQLENNKYRSENAVQFMIESLKELDKNLHKYGSRLFYFYGKPDKVIEQLIKKTNIQGVYCNRDYTPYAINRDATIKNICDSNNIQFNSYDDYALHKIGTILNGTGNPYVKYTPFLREAYKLKIAMPTENKKFNFIKSTNKFPKEVAIDKIKYQNNDNIAVHGGRKNALKIITNADNFKDYKNQRNFLSYETTKLSAYIKFGCVSIREVYWALKNNKAIINQLWWRDFYYQIIYFHPYILEKNKAMKSKYDKIKWSYDKNNFDKWTSGKTGFPIVDAGMRQLNETGYMHNRARLITSNFLVKILHIDWRLGEQYFASKLVDYDPANNNGGWQWGAGSGSDSQPYFRIFNPWRQQESYDEKCEYIKKWIPELKEIDNKIIHKWDKSNETIKDYSKPMVDYTEEVKKSLVSYSKIFKQ